MHALALTLMLAQAPAESLAPAPDPGVAAPSTVAPAIQPGQEVDWAIATLAELKTYANERKWGPFTSVLLMAGLSLFSFVFVRSRELRDALRDYMPEVAVITSMAGYAAIAVGTLPPGAEVADWWAVLGPALKTGAAAVGLYVVLVKRLLRFWGPKAIAGVKALWARLRGKLAPVKP